MEYIIYNITINNNIETKTRDKGSNNFIQCFLTRITFPSQYFSIASSNSSKSSFVLNDFRIFINFSTIIKSMINNLYQSKDIKDNFNKNYKKLSIIKILSFKK